MTADKTMLNLEESRSYYDGLVYDLGKTEIEGTKGLFKVSDKDSAKSTIYPIWNSLISRFPAMKQKRPDMLHAYPAFLIFKRLIGQVFNMFNKITNRGKELPAL